MSKKSCIVHGCDPRDCATHYGCTDEVSQSDVHRTETICHDVPTCLGMAPEGYDGPLDAKGPFLWVRETRREYNAGLGSVVCTHRNVSFTRIEVA